MSTQIASVAQAFDLQVEHMRKSIQRLERTGYLVAAHVKEPPASGDPTWIRNGWLLDDRYPCAYCTAGMVHWLEAWMKANQRRYLIINAWPEPDNQGRLFQGEFSARMRIRTLVLYKPIGVALNLIGQKQPYRDYHSRSKPWTPGMIRIEQGAQFNEYVTHDRLGFKAMLSILEMDMHRDILTSVGKAKPDLRIVA